MAVKIQLRRDEGVELVNVIPSEGEPVYGLDTKEFKIGDGVTKFVDLPNIGASELATGVTPGVVTFGDEYGNTPAARKEHTHKKSDIIDDGISVVNNTVFGQEFIENLKPFCQVFDSSIPADIFANWFPSVAQYHTQGMTGLLTSINILMLPERFLNYEGYIIYKFSCNRTSGDTIKSVSDIVKLRYGHHIQAGEPASNNSLTGYKYGLKGTHGFYGDTYLDVGTGIISGIPPLPATYGDLYSSVPYAYTVSKPGGFGYDTYVPNVLATYPNILTSQYSLTLTSFVSSRAIAFVGGDVNTLNFSCHFIGKNLYEPVKPLYKTSTFITLGNCDIAITAPFSGDVPLSQNYTRYNGYSNDRTRKDVYLRFDNPLQVAKAMAYTASDDAWCPDYYDANGTLLFSETGTVTAPYLKNVKYIKFRFVSDRNEPDLTGWVVYTFEEI